MPGFVTKKIGRRRSLGSILKSARTKADVSLEEAETKTKVRLKYLRALEEGNYLSLAAEAYNIGFVRAYAEFLKLNPERIVGLYRYERSESRVGSVNPTTFTVRRVNDWQFLITPKILATIGVGLLFGSVASYIGFQLRQFTQPPALAVTNVPEEFTTDKDTVALEGQTSQGATVTINAEPILVTPGGQFNQTVQLSPGVNEIVLLAKSRAEKQTREVIHVLYNQDLAKATTAGTTE